MNVRQKTYQKIKDFTNTHVQMRQLEKDIYIGMRNMQEQIQQILYKDVLDIMDIKQNKFRQTMDQNSHIIKQI